MPIQNCFFMSSKILLQDLKLDIGWWSDITSDNSGIYEIYKELLFGANGPFYPNFAPWSASSMHFFIFLHFWNFACRVRIVVSRKIKYETRNFQVFFKSSLLYLKFFLFLWPSTYRCCPVQSCLISYMINFHDFKSDMLRFCMQWADKSGIYKFTIQRRSLYGKSDIFKIYR